VVIKGGARAGPGELALHLLRADTNELVKVRSFDRVTATELRDALFEMVAMGQGSRSRRPLYHASINTPVWEALTEDQKAASIDRLGRQLGLDGQPRVEVEHIKGGRHHLHVVWLRIDPETGKAIPDSHNYRKHEEVARDLEREFGHERVQGAHHEREGVDRPGRRPSLGETRQGERSGLTPEAAKAQLRELWSQADTGQAFVAALDDAGWVLAQGDKRNVLVALDPAGETHAVNKDITGLSAAKVRERLADIDAGKLPSVDEAREQVRGRQPSPPRDPVQEETRGQEGETRGGEPSAAKLEPPAEQGAAAREAAQDPPAAAADQVQDVPAETERDKPRPPLTYGYSVRLEGGGAWTNWQAPALNVVETREHLGPGLEASQVAPPLTEATQQPSHEPEQAQKAELGRMAAVIAAAKERLVNLAGRLEAAIERHRERARAAEVERQARQAPPSFGAAVQRGLALLWGRPDPQTERQEPVPGPDAFERRDPNPQTLWAPPQAEPVRVPEPPDRGEAARAKPRSAEDFRIPRVDSSPTKNPPSPASATKGEALRQALGRFRIPGADQEHDFDIDL
jgi:hypothetical protein